MKYLNSCTLDQPFDQTVATVKAALADQGFGVLTEIDVRSTMKAKLGVDLDDHVILGACNPPLAYRAIQAEPSIGILLPCNVVVRSLGQDRTVVEIVDPATMVMMTENEELESVAADATARLGAVIDALTDQPSGE
ncbi:MAG: DUF302 domain-containing protein [Actinomycetes bacterium]